MPSLAPYIPPKDADFDNWTANFSTLITASPATYGLTTPDATNISNAVNPWHAAYLLVTSPTTKTPQTVSDKNTAKVNCLNVVRPYSQQVALNAGVSSANKIALGLNPRTSTPTPITAPTTAPVLSLISMGPGFLNFAFRDVTSSPSVKSKPYGVKSLQLWAKQSATVITDPNDLVQVQTCTKSPFQFFFPMSATPGAIWYFAGFWQTQTGLSGPWSSITNYICTGVGA